MKKNKVSKMVATVGVATALVFSSSAAFGEGIGKLHATDGQFDFSIYVSTSPYVTYGVKTPFTFSTDAKMSGSCSVYRWEQDSAWTRTRLGSATLKKGRGSGNVTWKWRSQSANPVMNLEVYCKVGDQYGAGYQVVTGQWGHD